MVTINPYLNFNGNTEEVFNFYKSVFGGEFSAVHRFGDSPEGGRVPEEHKDKLMHISLPIGNGNFLMGTDALESMGHLVTEGNNFQLSINTDSKEEADKIFNSLSANGKITLPMGMMPWGDYFGMFTDQFGIQWMISFNENRRA